MKGLSTLYPGAPLSPTLCDSPVFTPGASPSDGHGDATARAPHRHFQKILSQPLCRVHSQPLSLCQAQQKLSFPLSSLQAIWNTICLLWLGMLKTTRGVGSRNEEKGGVCVKWRKQTIFFFIYTAGLKDNPEKAIILKLWPQTDILMNPASQKSPYSCALCFLLYNKELEAISQLNNQQCREKHWGQLAPRKDQSSCY